jgi:ribosomal protein S1
LSWDGNGDELIKTFSKGNIVKAKILDVDVDKELSGRVKCILCH